MSDKKTASDLRVICHGEPQIKTITPKSGTNEGKEVSVLCFRAYHPVAEKQQDGSFNSKDPEWYSLQLFDNKAQEIGKFIKDGLVLRVSGEVKEREYTDKNGQKQIGRDLNVYSLAVDLKQRGLKNIDFQKPASK